MWFAWLLIILGVIMLMQNLGIMPEIKWSTYWPAILILFGIYLLSKRSDGCCNWKFWRKKEK